MRTLVITPTYGRIPFLGRAVASFLSQTYDDKELILINDDKNIEIVCESPGVTVINMNKKILVGQKRNIATQLGHHDLYLNLDDDDVFLPKRIENCVKIHQDNPEINLYRNLQNYTIYGESFMTTPDVLNAVSFTRKGWFEANGYTHQTNHGEDMVFLDEMPNKLEVCNDNLDLMDFVYNFGGLNYHLTFAEDHEVEHIAKEQLKELELTNGKFYIQPDFEEFNKFVKLEEIYRQTNKEVSVIHRGLGKIDLA